MTSSHKELAIFKTELGWFAILHQSERILRIKFGFPSRESALVEFAEEFGFETESKSAPVWQSDFTDYAQGKKVSFAKLKLDTSHLTEFQKTVTDQCRKIAYGETLTYGELAAKCNSPKAARAVGAVMKSNRFPIVIPCHRVVRACGLGGFSASSGVSAKQKMLIMEGAIKPESQMQLPGVS